MPAIGLSRGELLPSVAGSGTGAPRRIRATPAASTISRLLSRRVFSSPAAPTFRSETNPKKARATTRKKMRPRRLRFRLAGIRKMFCVIEVAPCNSKRRLELVSEDYSIVDEGENEKKKFGGLNSRAVSFSEIALIFQN